MVNRFQGQFNNLEIWIMRLRASTANNNAKVLYKVSMWNSRVFKGLKFYLPSCLFKKIGGRGNFLAQQVINEWKFWNCERPSRLETALPFQNHLRYVMNESSSRSFANSSQWQKLAHSLKIVWLWRFDVITWHSNLNVSFMEYFKQLTKSKISKSKSKKLWSPF